MSIINIVVLWGLWVLFFLFFFPSPAVRNLSLACTATVEGGKNALGDTNTKRSRK